MRNNTHNPEPIRKALLLAAKIAVGSALAIFIAHLFQLENPTSAGTVTLLTLVTTKNGTMKLAAQRIATFFVTVLLCFLTYPFLHSDFLAFGIVIFFQVLLTELTDTKATLSVNALIAMHYFVAEDYSLAFTANEFVLILIGIVIAIGLNMIQSYRRDTHRLLKRVEETDRLTEWYIGQLIGYMRSPEPHNPIWEKLSGTEADMQASLAEAQEFQDNTFSDHPQFFIDYFQMRIRQFRILHALHYKLRQIRVIPQQAHVVAEIFEVIRVRVVDHRLPEDQLAIIDQAFQVMEAEPLPKSREEFESRALLYTTLFDLQQFLKTKQEFIEHLNPESLAFYTHEHNGAKVALDHTDSRVVF